MERPLNYFIKDSVTLTIFPFTQSSCTLDFEKKDPFSFPNLIEQNSLFFGSKINTKNSKKCTFSFKVKWSFTKNNTTYHHFTKAHLNNRSIIELNEVRLFWVTNQRIKPKSCFGPNAAINFISSTQHIISDYWGMVTYLL